MVSCTGKVVHEFSCTEIFVHEHFFCQQMVAVQAILIAKILPPDHAGARDPYPPLRWCTNFGGDYAGARIFRGGTTLVHEILKIMKKNY